MANGATEPGGQYRAFLSYSHRDEKAVARLHRQLESYRLPKRLAGKDSAREPVPERLTPIFRDREELSAASSLADHLQAALAQSRSLIVMCSPDAKASRWVDIEIETFRALHPDRPVLAALLEGEPEEAFPSALTAGGLEPIAADFRKTGDGHQLALFKLIAGVAGVPLDGLIQRDAQRKFRRVTAITVGALIIALAMALLLVFAIQARNEAQRERQAAEGLVEYMLTDLRDGLKGVGRLDVMTSVNQRAMQYYSKQANLDALPPDSLTRRARILHAMGEDDGKRGESALALGKFREAHRTTATVLGKRPDDVDAIYSHSQSEFWLGYAKFDEALDLSEGKPRQIKLRSSLPHFVRYRELTRLLLSKEPNKPDWTREAGYAQGNLCTLALELEDSGTDAIAECTSATRYIETLWRDNPRDPGLISDFANRLAWTSDAYARANRMNEAVEFRGRQLALLRDSLRKLSNSREMQQNLMLAELGIAQLYIRAGKQGLARRHADLAAQLVDLLVSGDPENSRWRRWKEKISELQSGKGNGNG